MDVQCRSAASPSGGGHAETVTRGRLNRRRSRGTWTSVRLRAQSLHHRRRSEALWGLNAADPAVERLTSLMKANNATHVIILSHDPVALIVLAVPVISADPATETAIALVRRLLALTPEAA